MYQDQNMDHKSLSEPTFSI